MSGARGTSQLVSKAMVKENCLELALLRCGGRDRHGILTAARDQVGAVRQRRDGGRVERAFTIEGLKQLQCARVKETHPSVQAGRGEQGVVPRKLNVGDALGVALNDVDLLACQEQTRRRLSMRTAGVPSRGLYKHHTSRANPVAIGCNKLS